MSFCLYIILAVLSVGMWVRGRLKSIRDFLNVLWLKVFKLPFPVCACVYVSVIAYVCGLVIALVVFVCVCFSYCIISMQFYLRQMQKCCVHFYHLWCQPETWIHFFLYIWQIVVFDSVVMKTMSFYSVRSPHMPKCCVNLCPVS